MSLISLLLCASVVRVKWDSQSLNHVGEVDTDAVHSYKFYDTSIARNEKTNHMKRR